jgi:teichoic acid transport system permease protein
MPYVLRTWMYASGIFYSVAFFTSHLPQWATVVVQANPLLVYIELVRYALMTDPPLASSVNDLWLMGCLWAAWACLVGLVYFWRGEAEYGRG